MFFVLPFSFFIILCILDFVLFAVWCYGSSFHDGRLSKDRSWLLPLFLSTLVLCIAFPSFKLNLTWIQVLYWFLSYLGVAAGWAIIWWIDYLRKVRKYLLENPNSTRAYSLFDSEDRKIRHPHREIIIGHGMFWFISMPITILHSTINSVINALKSQMNKIRDWFSKGL